MITEELKIVLKGSRILETRCEDIFEPLEEDLIKAMFALMLEKGGVGLSANQVGIKKRFFVARFSGELIVCVNPAIVSRGKSEVTQPEGCLSILDESGNPIRKPKSRWEVIDVTYWDFKRNFVRRTLKRFDARIFQHEMDHLNGLFCQ